MFVHPAIPMSREEGESGTPRKTIGTRKQEFNDGVGEVTYIVKERPALQIFRIAFFTSAAFSIVFLASETVPSLIAVALPEWSNAATKALALAVWTPFACASVFVFSMCFR